MNQFLLKEESGQAILEYLLAVGIALSLVTIITLSMRNGLFSIWEKVSQEVSAACAGCPADPKLRLK